MLSGYLLGFIWPNYTNHKIMKYCVSGMKIKKSKNTINYYQNNAECCFRDSLVFTTTLKLNR